MFDAAAAAFAAKGFHEATTKDIADRLGLLPGSLYYYFDSKEAAFVEVCRRRGQGFNARLRAIVAGPGPVAEKVRAGIAQHLRHDRAELVATIAFSQRALPGGAAREPPREIERIAAQFADYFLHGALPRGIPLALPTPRVGGERGRG